MEVNQAAAYLKYARLSPQKSRLVANQIRGLPVDRALNVLNFSLKKSASVIKKLLESAIANAEHNQGLDVDTLTVETIYVDQGPRHRRQMARAKGRGARILKPTCHITVKLTATEGRYGS